MADREENRKRAYRYIVEQVKANMAWSPPIDSDKRLADFFDIPLDDLISLKEGRSDPSPKIVAEFKKHPGSLIPKQQIDSYLVTPFLPKP